MDQSKFDTLAPDGYLMTDQEMEHVILGLTGQKRGVNNILRMQTTKDKAVVSGAGTWVADEVLYQCHIHPLQTFLLQEEARDVVEKLKDILQIAVGCLADDQSFPDDWFFEYRWIKKKSGAKDAKGRAITFVDVGNRTCYFVSSIQKLRARGKQTNSSAEISPAKPAIVTPMKGSSKRKKTLEAAEPETPTRASRRKTRSSS